MKRIKVLDCTLRDGGYVNNWEFGSLGFDIVKSLYDSNIEIIECGFLNPNGNTEVKNNKINSCIDKNKFNNNNNNNNNYRLPPPPHPSNINKETPLKLSINLNELQKIKSKITGSEIDT